VKISNAICRLLGIVALNLPEWTHFYAASQLQSRGRIFGSV
jgi:hypothetical protein|tara:strand:- start:4628 stop:4750 length:123 start_codon:yes stop_codon:yes gene_type:complete